MKIEPFPWLREYYVDMNKLYTELILEKIENEVLGEKKRTLKGYVEMFDCKGRDKILMKGDPGIGKTTLWKKVGHDWAKGVFKQFSMIVFVFLKFVKPGETIENVIIQQNPELEGLNVTQVKLRACFEQFGNRCLIILDGLDEHGLGQNKDVLKIIRNQKMLGCGIAVSSRPHSISEVQQHFSTIVSVDSFTEEYARKFVSKFFTDKKEIEKIMTFKPSDSRESFPVHKSPILLSFLCIIVREKDIDLSDLNILIGDLYLKMVHSLYKKFTIRKGVQFVMSDFVRIVKKVGILALQTLLSNNPLLQKSEVFEITGDFAFEYGFFAGHEDFKLCTDPTADIYVTYGHRSLEEFFGSLWFIQGLDDGKSIDEILGSDWEQPIFMVNPLVLKFCLYLLSRQDLGFTHRDDCYEKLVSYVVNAIDHEQFAPHAIAWMYPAIDIMKSVYEGNRTELAFFRHVLEKCQYIKTLYLGEDIREQTIEKTDWFFGSLNKEVLGKLTLVSIGDYLPSEDCPDNTLTVSMNIDDTVGSELLDILLKKYHLRKRNPEVHLREEITSSIYDISTVTSQHIKEVHLWTGDHTTLITSGEIPHCPLLICLSLYGFQIDPSVPAAFTRAINEGKLPNLRCIELSDLTNNVANWPEVPEFCYQAHSLHLYLPGSDVQKLLSKLTCLMLQRSGLHNLHGIDRLFTQQLTKLCVLKLVGTDELVFSKLIKVLKQGKLPNLSELFMSGIEYSEGITHNLSLRDFEPKHTPRLEKVSLQGFIIPADELRKASQKLSSFQLRELKIRNIKGNAGCLSILFKNSLPALQSLTLGDKLHLEDMRSLSLASEQGKLPNLRHLFILDQRVNREAAHLFMGREKWNQLLTLRVEGCNVLGFGYEYLAS